MFHITFDLRTHQREQPCSTSKFSTFYKLSQYSNLFSVWYSTTCHLSSQKLDTVHGCYTRLYSMFGRPFGFKHAFLGPHSHWYCWQRTARVNQAMDVDSLLVMKPIPKLQNDMRRHDVTLAASTKFHLDLVYGVLEFCPHTDLFSHTNSTFQQLNLIPTYAHNVLQQN